MIIKQKDEIEYLDLSDKKITSFDRIAVEIGKFSNLKELDLQNNLFTSLPSNLY